MPTIAVSVETKKDLDAMKQHPRQTYEEIVKEMIAKTKGKPQ
jgi:hypothetical protein